MLILEARIPKPLNPNPALSSGSTFQRSPRRLGLLNKFGGRLGYPNHGSGFLNSAGLTVLDITNCSGTGSFVGEVRAPKVTAPNLGLGIPNGLWCRVSSCTEHAPPLTITKQIIIILVGRMGGIRMLARAWFQKPRWTGAERS